jgi:uridine phosphorylase
MPIALLFNLIGAPVTCMVLEEVIATGAKEIIEVGIAGGIQPYLKPGDILVITGAKRDEGTSYHYYPPDVECKIT